ncbi:cysteine desulfurase family protein [Abyssisolibacter fermentans]|uniref:cysteine desulfurase family protein n=1 Tax=Abyssisolibacter fermentans TaxID=1766203 RepID=UPI000834877E|nr:cysteine desulfurase family protein [Abyssisolibacter fermentans]
MNVYLDNSATTRVRDEVINEIIDVFKKNYGNPSSLHRMGFEVEKKVKNARVIISKFLNVNENEIFFTSGGTESNNIAVQGIINKLKRRGNHIVTTKIEHPSIMNIFKYYELNGFEVTYLDTNEFGLINLEQLEKCITENTILAAIMMVNNENGTIQPIDEIRKIIKAKNRNTKIHVDGIQAFGKLKVDLKKLGIDSFSFSGHKFHAPKGVGGLYLSNNINIEPVVYGAGQESGKRAGTENVPGIVGMGKAVEILHKNFKNEIDHVSEIKQYFIDAVKSNITDIRFNSYIDENCAPHVVNVSFLGTKAEVLLHYLENYNIFISTGSACSSRDKSVSKILLAMGLKEKEIEGAIRFSFSHYNNKEEVDYVVDKLKICISEIRKIMKR